MNTQLNVSQSNDLLSNKFIAIILGSHNLYGLQFGSYSVWLILSSIVALRLMKIENDLYYC